MRRLHSGRCEGVYFSSGSAPRFPIKMTLLTLPIAPSLYHVIGLEGAAVADVVGQVVG